VKAIVQRVSSAKVVVDGRLVGQCGVGLCVLVGIHRDDVAQNAVSLADRLVKLRIFNDEAGKMNLALGDIPASELPQILLISNFTVYGDAAKSRRPSFTQSAGFDDGKRLFDHLVKSVEGLGIRVETGEFGADMKVEIHNDGPVTLIVDA
jgi:D-tyrosyl-tRNA(Tyr) deacylase